MNSLGNRLVVLATLALFLVVIPAASAQVTATPYGNTSDAQTGGHGTLTTGVTFDYGSDSTKTVKRILLDNPPGGVGNPNAIPFEERCTKKQFETSQCGAKSSLGEITISAKAWVIPGLLGIDLNDQTGSVSQIQTENEVPTLVGAYVQPKLLGLPIGDPIRAYARFYPVTSGPEGDFRIRAETDEFPTTARVSVLGFGLATLPIQLTKYQQKLWGVLPNGNVFLTNPTRCETWFSGGYAEYFGSNPTADSDPLQTGKKTFFKSKQVPTTPDCRKLAPFDMDVESVVTGAKRGEHASYTAELKINGLGAKPISAAVPKTVVTTLPDAVTIDVAQLGRICSNEDFAAFKCPDSTRVGSVSVTTPMIKEGLKGDAHLVKAAPGRNLPDLGIHIDGMLEFNIRGTNQFVNISQIQTTFEDIPQIGFASLKLNIEGGSNGLLLVRNCPSDGSEPNDGGPTAFNLASYQGQTLVKNSPTKFSPTSCTDYSVSVSSAGKCLKKRSLSVRPRIRSLSEVNRVEYFVNGKLARTTAKSPFSARIKLSSKLVPGKTYRYLVKVYYKPNAANPNGRITTKSVKFKLCK